MCPDEGGSPRLSTAQPLDEYDRLFALSLPRKGTQMDKGEAERLDRAIQRASVKWIQVQEITFDPVALTYTLKCAYRQERRGLHHP